MKKSKSLMIDYKVMKCIQDKVSSNDYDGACRLKKKLEKSGKYISIGSIFVIDNEFVMFPVRKA